MFAPFDGRKALYHVRYWEPMLDGAIPPPVLVTLDPVNRCNLRCPWCNAAHQMSQSADRYSDATIDAMPAFLADWGVRAVCVAGGGEPTMHPRFSDLVTGLVRAGIQVGVVTNGTLMHRHVDALGLCRWVGVSVDAGNVEQYAEQKGVDLFAKVLENLALLRERFPHLELTYKYLIAPTNIMGLHQAAQHALRIGCNYFHARPMGRTAAEVQRGERSSPFTQDEQHLAVDILRVCKRIEQPGFRVQARTEKVGANDWGICHKFKRCWAVGMTAVIQPDGTCGLCCDRRGDPATKLCDWQRLTDISAAWGNERHRGLLGAVDLSGCPRCTYAPHNQVFEQFAIDKEDEVCKWFI